MAKTRSGNFYLANELVFQILSWLPVTSLLRFKSVCKSWFSIISSPAFIEAHLINSKKKQPSIIWISEVENSAFIGDAVYIHTSPSVLNEPLRIKLPPNLIGMTRCFRSCNGLLFHHNMNITETSVDYVSFIWNPLTKWFKIVPTPETLSKNFVGDLGFGFDFISSDYKILRIVFRSPYFDSVSEVELYSASGDSWKEIQVPDALRNFRPIIGSEFVHANGVLYLDGNKLLAFDLHSEVFGVFSLPNPLHYSRRSPVLDYEGSVAMIFEELDDKGLVRSLWILDDGSWTKKFDFEVDHLKYSWVYLYLGVGQFVVGRHYNREYIIYDHRKKQTKEFHTQIDDKLLPFMYTESLVSV